MSGIVFNIQPYSLHDGPGIRTMVFLKGCPLRCGWCANPESQNPFPEVYFDRAKCIHDKGCRFCEKVCDIENFSAAGINSGYNEKVRELENICPCGALGVYGREMTAEEVIERVERDSAFYAHGGGGLTLSGGEPFYQGEFALEILRLAKKLRINTSAETCGFCNKNILRGAAELLDSIMFDIKLLDSGRHEQFTGVSNNVILENLEMLFEEFPDLHKHIRTPVIPTVNDNERDISEIKNYLRGRENYSYELLPYHRFGVGKYELLGREYGSFPRSVDEALLERLNRI